MSEGEVMKTSRRGFLKISAAAGGALAVGVSFGAGCANPQVKYMEEASARGALAPNAYLTIEPTGEIVYTLDKAEMGQGVMTSHAMMVAEELDVALEQITVALSDADPRFGPLQVTGGSTSVMNSYIPVRTAAASVREMLVGAAAARWGVAASECAVADGVVTHPSGKKATYGELAGDASRQPIPDAPKLKKPSEFKIIGKAKGRVDAAEKSTGRAVFGLDVEVPGLLRAWMLHPPTPHGRVKSMDADEAKAMAGVVDVIAFERGVAVVAEKTWQAMRAARALTVEWEAQELAGFDSEALRQAMEARAYEVGSAVRQEGDVDAQLAREDVTVLDAIYEAPYLAHATMEPQNTTAWFKGDELEIWAPTQSTTITQSVGRQLTGVPHDRVIVHTTLMGGGFGRRAAGDFVAEAVILSKKLGKPVQVVWSREEDMRVDYFRPQALARFQAAVDREGRVAGVAGHVITQSIFGQSDMIGSLFPHWVPEVTKTMLSRTSLGLLSSGTVADPTSIEGLAEMPYGFETTRIEYSQLNVPVPVGAWRSVGHSFNAFFAEGFTDELAHAAGQDPFAFRKEMMGDRHPRLLRVLEEAAKRAGWGTSKADGLGRGIAAHHSFRSYCAQVVDARVVDGRIKVERVVCAFDCGTVINPDVVKAQMEGAIIFGLAAALDQEITFVDGVVQQSNFDDFPLLRMHEAPEIEVYVIDSDADPTGAGEPGLPPVAPALANALYDATGVRVRRMPMQRELTHALAMKGGAK
jgi:CO/xanthine dehydrogenase Mo-binding subunit